MSSTPSATPAGAHADQPSFTPVPVRPRHDGWTPGKQVMFLHALAETANVDEACRRVGMSQQSAYTLRTRTDAVSFRQAWAIALDHGTARLADKATARAMNGVVVPIFYKGEKVGERRVFNERLTQFLLRAHLPERYGAWRDQVTHMREDPDGLSTLFKQAVIAVAQDGLAEQTGQPRPTRAPLQVTAFRDSLASDQGEAYDGMVARFRDAMEASQREIDELRQQLRAATSGGDGGSTWPTSDTAPPEDTSS